MPIEIVASEALTVLSSRSHATSTTMRRGSFSRVTPSIYRQQRSRSPIDSLPSHSRSAGILRPTCSDTILPSEDCTGADERETRKRMAWNQCIQNPLGIVTLVARGSRPSPGSAVRRPGKKRKSGNSRSSVKALRGKAVHNGGFVIIPIEDIHQFGNTEEIDESLVG